MTDAFDEIMNELKSIKQTKDKAFENNLITSTVSKLLDVEKLALYGTMKNKNKTQELIINEGLGRYKDKLDADS